MQKVVFYFCPNSNACYEMHFRCGFLRYARTKGWRLITIDTAPTPDARRMISRLIREYSPLGAVCSLHEGVEDAWPDNLPCVWVDTYPNVMKARQATVYVDNAALSQIAAEELLRDRKPRTYACFSLSGIKWACERAKTFALAIQASGDNCRILNFDIPNGKFPHYIQLVKNALRDLPRPLGVFAINDQMASQLIIAAEILGLRVPNDLSLVGVDNDESLCLTGQTTITSIQIDWDHCGWLAGEALHDLMLGKSTCLRRTYGPIALIRRASTLSVARRENDSCINRALAFIRENAAAPISVPDIIAVMGCSRRLGEQRFRESTGKSILNELHLRRLDLVKAQLNRSQTSVAAMANLCGFRSSSALRAFFHAQTGMSISEWRMKSHEADSST